MAGLVIVGDCDTIGRAGPRIERLRQAKVQHLHGAVGPHLDVRRLQIAVDDPLLVRGFERLGDLPRDRQRFIERNRPSRDAIGERRAFDQLQDERASRHPRLRGRRCRRCSDDSARRATCASRLKRASRSGSSAKAPAGPSGRRRDPACVSRARYTSPMPPAPRAERISYGPRRTPGCKDGSCGSWIIRPRLVEDRHPHAEGATSTALPRSATL